MYERLWRKQKTKSIYVVLLFRKSPCSLRCVPSSNLDLISLLSAWTAVGHTSRFALHVHVIPSIRHISELLFMWLRVSFFGVCPCMFMLICLWWPLRASYRDREVHEKHSEISEQKLIFFHVVSICISLSLQGLQLLRPSWNIRHSTIQNLSPNIKHHRSFW
jgi:hypothetical protein